MSLRPRRQLRRGLPLRALIPNAVTALAFCSGVTGVRFGIAGEWEKAIAAIVVAAVLDGLDGRIARLLRGESRFGAELDSLSDVSAFGVAPALIVYLWSLQALPPVGWIFALAHGVCCALRLARFNASIDAEVGPMKSAGFLTGVPAPAGAGLVFLPLYLWLSTGIADFRAAWIVGPWTALVAFLMVSSIPTYSWASLRIRREARLGVLVAVGLVGASLISAPWPTLTVAAIAYLASLPFGMAGYAKVRRQRAQAGAAGQGDTPVP